MKCKKEIEIKNPAVSKTIKGVPITKGICPICGTKVARIGGEKTPSISSDNSDDEIKGYSNKTEEINLTASEFDKKGFGILNNNSTEEQKQEAWENKLGRKLVAPNEYCTLKKKEKSLIYWKVMAILIPMILLGAFWVLADDDKFKSILSCGNQSQTVTCPSLPACPTCPSCNVNVSCNYNPSFSSYTYNITNTNITVINNTIINNNTNST